MSRLDRFLIDVAVAAIAVGLVLVLFAAFTSEPGHAVTCAASMKPCP
jgi:hypothetical protein